MVFIKKVENFVCEKCGREVRGGGYTNHCPSCLWSKHVDVDPGDREEGCGGMMKPVEVLKSGKDIKILHKCQSCGFERVATLVLGDNMEAVWEV